VTKDIKNLTLELISQMAVGYAQSFNIDTDQATIEILKALNSNIINDEIYKQISYNLEDEEV